MLLRREYCDKLDKPGMAEPIVAKNRHGRIGDVSLVFSKEYARFDNYAREESAAQHNRDWDSLGA
jgi:replicative DNA helicase